MIDKTQIDTYTQEFLQKCVGLVEAPDALKEKAIEILQPIIAGLTFGILGLMFHGTESV